MCHLIIAGIRCRNDIHCLFTITLRGNVLCKYTKKVHVMHVFQNLVILLAHSVPATNLIWRIQS